ncbi:MAG: tRNA pseudouridine(13) synthase TruD [Phycisphaerales bacterium JB038]
MTCDLVYATPDVPPLGGRLKRRPEDFFVEEVPSYEPCGEGEHLYLFIEKRGKGTLDVVRSIARHFSVRRAAVGYAGLKDKHAVTRQQLSVYLPGKDAADFGPLTLPGVEVLRSSRHTNKLRRGHLRGNRFIIYLRDVDPDRVGDAQRILDHLVRTGVPNRFGEQRFGNRRLSDELGKLLLKNDAEAFLQAMLGVEAFDSPRQRRAHEAFSKGNYERALELMPTANQAERDAVRALKNGKDSFEAVRAVHDSSRRFLVSSFQSRLFNQVLHTRLKIGRTKLQEGDLAFRHVNGSVFRVTAEENMEELAARESKLEIAPSGPLWGPSMIQAEGVIGDLEAQVLGQAAVTLDDFLNCRLVDDTAKLGQRRPLFVPVHEPTAEAGEDELGPYIKCRFELPRGAYATVVLEEIMKSGAQQAGGE